MYSGINYDIIDKKSGEIVHKARATSCWGGYTKGSYINDYKNHTAILYIPEYLISTATAYNQEGRTVLTVNKNNTYLYKTISSNEKFNTIEDWLKAHYEFISEFKYPIEYKGKSSLTFDQVRMNTSSKYEIGQGLSVKELNEIPVYVVHIHLSQCKSHTDARQALFLARQPLYHTNIEYCNEMLLVKDLLKNDLSNWDIFQLIEFIRVKCIYDGQRYHSEYYFFNRCYKTGEPYGSCYARYFELDDFRNIFINGRSDRVDTVIHQYESDSKFDYYNFKNIPQGPMFKDLVKKCSTGSNETKRINYLKIFEKFKNGEF